MNEAAQALGRLGAGKKKTISPEALKQRRKAARISGKKRKGRKLGPRKTKAPEEIVVESAVPVEVEPEIDDTVRCCPECGTPYEDGLPCTYCHPPTAQTPQNGDAPAGDESVPEVDPDFEARRHLLS